MCSSIEYMVFYQIGHGVREVSLNETSARCELPQYTLVPSLFP